MAGIQPYYSPANADFTLKGSLWPWSRAFGWGPDGYWNLEDVPVLVRIPSGGWDGAHATSFNLSNAPHDAELGGGGLYDELIGRGWAVFQVELPPGWNVNPFSRFHPCATWTEISRYVGRFVQTLKSNSHLLGNLATGYQRYVLETSSSSAAEALYAMHQPAGWLAYNSRLPQQSVQTPYKPRFDHRVKGVLNVGGAADFTKYNSTAISSGATPRFMPREQCFTSAIAGTTAFQWVDPQLKLDGSCLPLIEANYQHNKTLGIFQDYSLDVIGISGVSNGRAQGSALGSGTLLVFSGTPSGGTPAAGNRIRGGTSGAIGTVVGYNPSATIGKCVYVERDNTTQFSLGETCSMLGGPWSFTLDTARGGSNAHLSFLDSDAAMALWDAAGMYGELADCQEAHEPIMGLAIKRALDRNDWFNRRTSNSLHVHWIGNDHVRGLDASKAYWANSGAYQGVPFSALRADARFGGVSAVDAQVDWMVNTLEITT